MNILFSLFSKQRDIMIQVANMRQHLWLLPQEEIKIKMVAQASTHFLHQQYPVQQPWVEVPAQTQGLPQEEGAVVTWIPVLM